ncbi:MAG: 3-deoxy-7-phosphoheptulonate synthase [Deltaproteobacteria bacterium]|nr:MAG: 3-deoxy-7-phosphoheptulonate synthase [Deltaproteobacteria bacterium]
MSRTQDEGRLQDLRRELEDINHAMLRLLGRRGRVVRQVGELKRELGMPLFVPQREQQMLERLVQSNPGPFPEQTIRHLFREIFSASVALMEQQQEGNLQVCRRQGEPVCSIPLAGLTVGSGQPVIIAGPCAVESRSQMEMVASGLRRLGVRLLRGGTFKPRTSPYSFQGMGEPGLKLLAQVARENSLATVTEVMDTRHVQLVAEYADVLQIGARNMHNYSLLKEVGLCRKPVLLKRGLAATLKELLLAAEYIWSQGNQQIILCERGIRTFEREYRNTLDISAVPLLKQSSRLPVIVDVSHAAGRKDILAALARAALAAGCDGIMVEVHPFPVVARSDNQQQLDLDEFARFLEQVDPRASWQGFTGEPSAAPRRRQGGQA